MVDRRLDDSRINVLINHFAGILAGYPHVFNAPSDPDVGIGPEAFIYERIWDKYGFEDPDAFDDMMGEILKWVVISFDEVNDHTDVLAIHLVDPEVDVENKEIDIQDWTTAATVLWEIKYGKV